VRRRDLPLIEVDELSTMKARVMMVALWIGCEREGEDESRRIRRTGLCMFILAL
jgi:hypothetical protein